MCTLMTLFFDDKIYHATALGRVSRASLAYVHQRHFRLGIRVFGIRLVEADNTLA